MWALLQEIFHSAILVVTILVCFLVFVLGVSPTDIFTFAWGAVLLYITGLHKPRRYHPRKKEVFRHE